jgi:hypothetical protein
MQNVASSGSTAVSQSLVLYILYSTVLEEIVCCLLLVRMYVQ